MEKYGILLAYFNKQLVLIEKLHKEIVKIDVSIYDKRFVFSLKVQQFYTALEDLFKQIAKAFENHIENLNNYHKEILIRMNMEVQKIRPAVISSEAFLFLDKVRGFRHFIRHAYDCELDETQLLQLQDRIKTGYSLLKNDLEQFRFYIKTLTN